MVVAINGTIAFHDDDQFSQLIGTRTGGLVILSSLGGNLDASLKIGKLIRARGFTTGTAGDCESSCALIWLAGIERYVAATARVGFHAAYTIGDNGEQLVSGTANALIGAYLTNLGLPTEAVVYITQAKPDEITWLTAQSVSYGITYKFVTPREETPPSAEQQPVAPAPQPQVQPATSRVVIGPSFDCSKVTTQVALFLCSDPDLSQIDVVMVQPYYVLRHQVGPTGWKTLLAQATRLMDSTYVTCGIDPTGMVLPADRAALKTCLMNAYMGERAYWMTMLNSPGREEAMRSIGQHILLQGKLQRLGYIPASDKIDGIYGTATRTTITNWQQSVGLVPNGYLSDCDAAKLMATSMIAPVATLETPSPATMAMVGVRLKSTRTASGIIGVIADIQKCYKDAVGQAAIRECMLYDLAGFYLDVGFTKAMGHPEMRQSYFSDAAIENRIGTFAIAGFGGWNDRAKTYLRPAANTIVNQALAN